MATHSSILAWRIPWMEEPGGPPSMGSQRVRYDLATNTYTLNNQVEKKTYPMDACQFLSPNTQVLSQ